MFLRKKEFPFKLRPFLGALGQRPWAPVEATLFLPISPSLLLSPSSSNSNAQYLSFHLTDWAETFRVGSYNHLGQIGVTINFLKKLAN